MKLLQNSAGNFLGMSPEEAKKFAAKLLQAAEDCQTAAPGRGAGFVQTIVLTERSGDDRVLDVVHVGVQKTYIDIHASIEGDLKPREPWIRGINRADVNVQLKEGL
jgi:hypothetical protein